MVTVRLESYLFQTTHERACAFYRRLDSNHTSKIMNDQMYNVKGIYVQFLRIIYILLPSLE
jgi:hypothetical protein